jgi:hypothetical protein
MFADRFFFASMSVSAEQKIVVICDFSEQMKEVIVHGIRMSDMLKKELCLTAIWKRKGQKSQFQEKLAQTCERLKILVPSLKISSLLLQKSLTVNMPKLVSEYNAILLVLHQGHVRWAMPAFRQSSIAFLFVKGEDQRFLRYKNVLVPVDFRKAAKETSLWASYLGRFNQSKVHLIYARETERECATNLTRNLNFFCKFLASLKVEFTVIEGKTSSWGICSEAIDRTNETLSDVVIVSGSSTITLIDLLIGLPEKKLIKRAGNLPVLMINPRKDICVLCD